MSLVKFILVLSSLIAHALRAQAVFTGEFPGGHVAKPCGFKFIRNYYACINNENAASCNAYMNQCFLFQVCVEIVDYADINYKKFSKENGSFYQENLDSDESVAVGKLAYRTGGFVRALDVVQNFLDTFFSGSEMLKTQGGKWLASVNGQKFTASIEEMEEHRYFKKSRGDEIMPKMYQVMTKVCPGF
ncbi:hypothetical protein M3Y97_01143000 [Aphelenchoides bicaudatus]|nr:hypothetical protein M3Y97_01143000 [Aphelenchoides bicaudatus]